MIDLDRDRIVVTGGAGFLGNYLRAELRAQGVPEQNLLVPLIEDFDLTCEADVARMYREMKPDVVIHLAALVGGIGANRENPGRFFYANMAMGLHLIEHARRVGLKKFVQVGTICAYPKFTPVPFEEQNLWNGYPEETNAPYGIAKKALLVMLNAYRQQYGMGGIYLLPVNLYGPGDNFNPQSSHVIPALIRKFCEAQATGQDRVVVWGTGQASREFLYVEDCAALSRWPRSSTTSRNPLISAPASRSPSASWPRPFATLWALRASWCGTRRSRTDSPAAAWIPVVRPPSLGFGRQRPWKRACAGRSNGGNVWHGKQNPLTNRSRSRRRYRADWPRERDFSPMPWTIGRNLSILPVELRLHPDEAQLCLLGVFF